MPIQIESLPLDSQNRSIALPEANSPIFSSYPLQLNFDFAPDVSQETDVYGGNYASTAILPSSPVDVASSPTLASTNNTPASTGNWSTSLQTLLDRPPPTLPNHLVVGGVMFCTALATWSVMARIDEVGRAQGRLVPQGETYKVSSVVSGKVANIYVQEGQPVRAGQVVASLDNAIALNRVQWSMQVNTNYEKEFLQTESLIDKARLEARTRSAIATAEIRAQEAAIAQAEAKIQSQATAISQAENRVATGQLMLAQLQTNLSSQRERLARFEYLANEGALAKEQVFQAEQQLSDRQRSLTQQFGEIQQSQADSQRMRSELQQAVAESRRLRAELNRKYAEASDAQLQSQQAIQQLMVQKTQLQAKMQQNQKQLVQAKAELNQLTLRAPADGYVSTLNLRRAGEVAQAGQAIAEIAPQGAPLILSAALPTREAGFVKVGDRTQIKFDAYPYQDYGVISGKVTAISPDIKSDEKLGAVYRVEITLDRNSVTKDQQTIPLKAGQTATAEIIVRHRRIADVLLDPIRRLQETNLNL